MASKKKTVECKPTRGKRTGRIFMQRPEPFQTDSMQLALRPGLRKTPDYITDPVFPEVTSTTWRCKRKPTDEEKKLGKTKVIRPCHIELAFVGDKLSDKFNVPKGAYLRLCMEYAGDAYLIPVKDHADALKKSREICECHKKKSRRACAAPFDKKYLERPPGRRRVAKRKKGEKPECLKWSKDGKRCLRRAKD